MANLYKILIEENSELWDKILPEIPSCEFKIANPKEKYDYYIKESFIKGKSYLPNVYLNSSDQSFGFKKNDRFYDRYFSENIGIKEILSPEIVERYDNGLGREFSSGKFYSVASSSRLAVSSFSEMKRNKIDIINSLLIDGKTKSVLVKLEDNLQILKKTSELISSPQMDVSLELQNDEKYFIEVKCHEILDSHKNVMLRWKYIDSEFLERFPIDLGDLQKKIKKTKYGVEEYISKNGNYLTVKDFGCNVSTLHFDFKQFICHLMGILNYQRRSNEKIHFYYLFYKNNEYIEKENSNIYNELEDEIETIFSNFRKLFPEIDFGYMYNDGFYTLKNLSKCT